MILTVGNTKGGVGKTTLAVNLAIARTATGRDVLLIDGDEQGTASLFTELRTEQVGRPGYTAVTVQGAGLRTQVRQLAAWAGIGAGLSRINHLCSAIRNTRMMIRRQQK
jgi:chromosome partitioning protein